MTGRRRSMIWLVCALTSLTAGIAAAAAMAAGTQPAQTQSAQTQPTQTQPAQTQPPREQIGGFACRKAQNPLNRLVEITATMRPISGTERMAMRFQLQQELPWSTYHQIYGGDLDYWRYPSPTTFGQQPGDTWVVNKPVANLHAPARYRFKVTFKWTTWAGQVTTATKLSSVCHEPA